MRSRPVPAFNPARVRERREALGFTREALARRADLPLQTLADLETGRTKSPKADTIARVADALVCTMDDLFGDADEEEPTGRSFGHLRLVGAAS